MPTPCTILPCVLQDALEAYNTAQRLDQSTDEALEQAERVKALIANGGYAESPFSAVPEEETEEMAEGDEQTPSGSMASAAAKAAAAATAAAATAAALASPRNRPVEESPERPPLVSGPGGDASGGADAGGLGKWGALGQGERDSDCMSCDTSLSNQALLPPGVR